MSRHPWLNPGPFALAGGPVGVLLIHGFTGSPPEMRPLGDFLARHGYTVLAPLLPGHGTEPEDLNRVRWQDWTAAVEAAYADLASRTAQQFVAGLSMGALLALHLASADLPGRLRGVILFAPGMRTADWRLPLTPLARYVRPLLPRDPDAPSDLGDPTADRLLWSYEAYPVGGASQLWRLQRAVRKRLRRVTAPILIFQGRRDRAVRPDSPQFILDRVSSAHKELIWLERSGHALTVDQEKEAVFQRCLEFIRTHSDNDAGGQPR